MLLLKICVKQSCLDNFPKTFYICHRRCLQGGLILPCLKTDITISGLTARSFNYTVSEEIVVSVEVQMKIGNYSVAFLDMNRAIHGWSSGAITAEGEPSAVTFGIRVGAASRGFTGRRKRRIPVS